MLSFCATTIGAQEIYRTVDKDGNVVFSDKPSKGSEMIKLKDTTIIKSLKSEPTSLINSVPEEKKIIPYKSISITTPLDDEAIRNNAGDISVKVEMEPMLRPGHEVVLYLDGSEKIKGKGGAFNLKNIDRGTHQLRASVKDSEGHILISSKSTTFHLLRPSIIMRKKQAESKKPPTQAPAKTQ